MKVGRNGAGDVVAAEQEQERRVVGSGQRRDLAEAVGLAEDGHAAGERRMRLVGQALRVLGVGVARAAALHAAKGGVAKHHVELELDLDARVHHGHLLQPGASGAGLVDDDVCHRRSLSCSAGHAI